MGKIKTLDQIQAEEYEARTKEARPYQTSKLLIIYARQSTINQFINNVESQQEQALDLMDYGARLGWIEELRLLFIENQLADGTIKNASGRLRIEEREGLQAGLDLIKRDKVGAILVSSIDRLFRDETQVQAAVFAAECKSHGVQILTLEGDIYDFNVPSRKDTEDFLEAAKEAAEYLNHIRRMNRRRERKALRGEYAGHGVPTGFMLDGDRKHRNYVANPVWSPIMAGLLRRFRELGGNFAALREEVVGKPIFPELPDDIKQRVGRIYLTQVPGGYSINSWSGLRNMLINPALIGHKLYKGRLIKDSHPAIVDASDFWYAFNILSNTDIDGNERKAGKRIVRKSSSALLSGARANGEATLLSSQGNVYVFQPEGKEAAYVINHFDQGREAFVASIRVCELDQMFEEILLIRLAEVAQRQVAGTPYDELCDMQETALVSVHESIAQARKELARVNREHDVNFDLMTNKELRENRIARNELLRQIEELENKVREAETAKQDLCEVQCLLCDAGKTWADLSLEKKRRYIKIITSGVWLNAYKPGWLRLDVIWSPIMGLFDDNRCIIWQQSSSKVWSEEEIALLMANYSSQSRACLINTLPYRSWRAIRTQAYRLKVQRGNLRETYDTLPDWLCLADMEALIMYPHSDIKHGTTLLYAR